MPDDQGSSTRSEEDSRSGLWAGLRTLLFGGDKEPSLREQIEGGTLADLGPQARETLVRSIDQAEQRGGAGGGDRNDVADAFAVFTASGVIAPATEGEATTLAKNGRAMKRLIIVTCCLRMDKN